MEKNIEKIKKSFEDFFQVNGRYPKSSETPFSRYLQRHHGGIVAFRKMIGINDDYRKFFKFKNSQKDKIEIFNFLLTKFEKRDIHTNVQLFDDSRSSIDFKVFDKFYVDAFEATSLYSLLGCVNIKIKKYQKAKIDLPVYLVSMNPNISQASIEALMANKKNKLPDNFKCVTYEQFKVMV